MIIILLLIQFFLFVIQKSVDKIHLNTNNVIRREQQMQ